MGTMNKAQSPASLIPRGAAHPQSALQDLFMLQSWTFLSFAHVDAVVRKLRPGSCVMSIGGGTGLLTDRVLSYRYPGIRFVGTDLRPASFDHAVLPANLVVRSIDICAVRGSFDFDLVYSVECLEHIEDDRLAVENMLSFLRPGGSLMAIVPFSPQEDRHDTRRLEEEQRRHGHVRLGYDPDDLKRLVDARSFSEVRLESCYWSHSAQLRKYKETVVPTLGAAVFHHLEILARQDIQIARLAKSRAEAVGLKLLAIGKQ